MKMDVHSILGVVLFFISIITTSILLNPNEELSNYLNRKIDIAISHGQLLAYILTYYTILGIWELIQPSEPIIQLLKLGGFAMLILLIYMNLRIIYNLVRMNFKPALNKNLLDVIMYFAVAWLIIEKIPISWIIIGIISVILTAFIFIFNIRLFQYSRLISILPQPVDIFPVFLGYRIAIYSAHIFRKYLQRIRIPGIQLLSIHALFLFKTA